MNHFGRLHSNLQQHGGDVRIHWLLCEQVNMQLNTQDGTEDLIASNNNT